MKIDEIIATGKASIAIDVMSQNPELIDYRTEFLNETVLMSAIRSGSIDLVRWLVNAGASIDDSTWSGVTALHLAAETNQLEISQILLDLEADAGIQDKEGKSPLHYATSRKMIELLLKNRADPEAKDQNGSTPLLEMASHCLEGIDALLDAGAIINATDKWGMTPLHQSANHGQYAISLLLLERGADKNATDVDGKRPYDYAIYRNQVPELIEILK